MVSRVGCDCELCDCVPGMPAPSSRALTGARSPGCQHGHGQQERGKETMAEDELDEHQG